MSQPKTQATTTREELTEEERPCSVENPSADNNGQLPKSVLPITKTPSPDVYGHYPPMEPEPLGQKKTGLQRYDSHVHGGVRYTVYVAVICTLAWTGEEKSSLILKGTEVARSHALNPFPI